MSKPIETVRDPRLSLWQSAVAETVRQELAASRSLSSEESLASATQVHPMMQAANAHVLWADPEEHANVRDLDDYESEEDVEAVLSNLYYKLAEAIRRGDHEEEQELLAEIDRYNPEEYQSRGLLDDITEDFNIRKYSTKDLFGWASVVKHYLNYYTLFKDKPPQYRDWKKQGQEDINYGVIEYKLPNDAKIAMIGDWGSGLDDAKHLLLCIMQNHKPQAVIHLGDIYYSGTQEECQSNFIDIFEEVFEQVGYRVPVFTIPGNHEYYSGGIGFYHVLDTINQSNSSWQQQASYFCLRSEDNKWQFLGMDTGYNDYKPWAELVLSQPTYLEPNEIQWQQDKLDHFNGQSILLSHHQLFSANASLHSDPPFLNNNLLFPFEQYFKEQIAAWFWGHEHNLVLYQNDLFGLKKGRLLGCSAYEESTEEGPYNVTYPEVPYLDPYKYRLGSSKGYYNHGFAMLSLERSHPDDPINITYYQYPSWGGTLEAPSFPAIKIMTEPLGK